MKTFSKILTANDTGQTLSHQAGLHIPKSNQELIEFLPKLDPSQKNPDSWILCIDENYVTWKFRFVHYNNKLTQANGTRDEYRLTHTTNCIKSSNAMSGDELVLAKSSSAKKYKINIKKRKIKIPEKIKLKGWRRVY